MCFWHIILAKSFSEYISDILYISYIYTDSKTSIYSNALHMIRCKMHINVLHIKLFNIIQYKFESAGYIILSVKFLSSRTVILLTGFYPASYGRKSCQWKGNWTPDWAAPKRGAHNSSGATHTRWPGWYGRSRVPATASEPDPAGSTATPDTGTGRGCRSCRARSPLPGVVSHRSPLRRFPLRRQSRETELA